MCIQQSFIVLLLRTSWLYPLPDLLFLYLSGRSQELKRLDDNEGVAVFSIDFDAIDRKDQLMKWLAESWGPAVSRFRHSSPSSIFACTISVAAVADAAVLFVVVVIVVAAAVVGMRLVYPPYNIHDMPHKKKR